MGRRSEPAVLGSLPISTLAVALRKQIAIVAIETPNYLHAVSEFPCNPVSSYVASSTRVPYPNKIFALGTTKYNMGAILSPSYTLFRSFQELQGHDLGAAIMYLVSLTWDL